MKIDSKDLGLELARETRRMHEWCPWVMFELCRIDRAMIDAFASSRDMIMILD